MLDVNSSRGKLIVETGSMNGSKTEHMIRYLQNIKEHTPFRVIAFTNNIDTRDSANKIVANGGFLEFPAHTLDVNNPEEIFKILEEEDKYKFVDVVGIDEVNFYNHKLIPVLIKLKRQNRVIITAGLDLNFRGEGFAPMNRVIEIANKVNRHYPYCKMMRGDRQCSNLARYTVRVRKDSSNKIHFFSKIGELVTGFGYAPYYDRTTVVEGSSDNIAYTVACEQCFDAPGKDDVINIQQGLLKGKDVSSIPNHEQIVKFLIDENILEFEEGKYLPVPHIADIASGMYIPLKKL